MPFWAFDMWFEVAFRDCLLPKSTTGEMIAASSAEIHNKWEFTMARASFKWLIIANVIFGFNAPGWAQDPDQGKTELPRSNTSFAARWSPSTDVGETEYLSSCAACHGTDGKGNGPLSDELKIEACRPHKTRQEKRRRVSYERDLRK
jgi:hypothetical protein